MALEALPSSDTDQKWAIPQADKVIYLPGFNFEK